MNAPLIFTPEQIEAAAAAAADPEAIARAAVERFPTDPGAIYEDEAIDALRTIRRKSEATYTRLVTGLKGQRTRLDKLTKPEAGRTPGPDIIAIARQAATFVHTENEEGVALIDRGTHREIHRVQSQSFRRWLSGQVYQAARHGIPEMAMTTALATLTAIGAYEGDRVTLHSRCAQHEGSYYLDLCNEAWQVLRIGVEGFEVLDRSPVHFVRAAGMRALPVPEGAGDVNLLWKHVNIPESARLLVLTWLIDSLRPDTPYPVLELSGEMGSSKSTTQSRLRALIDPHEVPLRSRPKSVEDIHVAAANAHVVSFENLSSLNTEQQDAFCILSTGGGYATRQFYTNGAEHVTRSKCPVLLNGINPVASQPDLIERVIGVELPTITAGARRDEQSLERAWQEDYPRIFTGLMHLFSEALALIPTVEIPDGMQKRMLDFQRLGEAVCTAQGGAPGDFSQRLDSLHGEGVIRGLESYGIAAALQVLLANRGDKPSLGRAHKRKVPAAEADKRAQWSGTFLQLLHDLNSLPEIDRANWPRSARHLSSQLKRIAPGLRRLGLRVERGEHTRSGALVEIWRGQSEI